MQTFKVQVNVWNYHRGGTSEYIIGRVEFSDTANIKRIFMNGGLARFQAKGMDLAFDAHIKAFHFEYKAGPINVTLLEVHPAINRRTQ